MNLDDDIVNAKRLVIMSLLFLLREMQESDLRKVTNLSWGCLSTHLARLEKKGYIERKRKLTTRGFVTVVRITEKGYRKYCQEVEKLRKLLRFK